MILEIPFSDRLDCARCSSEKVNYNMCKSCIRLTNFTNHLSIYKEDVMRSMGEMNPTSFYAWIRRELKESVEIGKHSIEEYRESDTPQDMVIRSTNNYSILLHREIARYLHKLLYP